MMAGNREYRLVTTMTKRSNHMPVFTTIEMKNMNGILVRSLRDHSVVSGIDQVAGHQHPVRPTHRPERAIPERERFPVDRPSTTP